MKTKLVLLVLAGALAVNVTMTACGAPGTAEAGSGGGTATSSTGSGAGTGTGGSAVQTVVVPCTTHKITQGPTLAQGQTAAVMPYPNLSAVEIGRRVTALATWSSSATYTIDTTLLPYTVPFQMLVTDGVAAVPCQEGSYISVMFTIHP